MQCHTTRGLEPQPILHLKSTMAKLGVVPLHMIKIELDPQPRNELRRPKL